MKKRNLLLIITLFTTFLNVAYGQPFNEKFFYNLIGTPQIINPTDIIVDGKGYSCTIGSLSYSTTHTDFTIQKTDFSGSPAMYKYYRLHTTTGDAIQATRVVKTKDSGYIIVGYYFSSTVLYRGSTSAFAVKLDANGNFVWGNTYSSMKGSQPNVMGSLSRVNITPVIDDTTTESYIISYSSMNDSAATDSGDVYIHALRIDNSGNVLWHNRYIPNNRSSMLYSDLRDYVSALTYANDGTKSMYFIGGTSELWATSGVADSLFLFGINNKGKVVNNLRHYYVPTYPFYVDAIYDNTPGLSGLVLSYTMGNSSFPAGVSAAALTKMDLNFLISFTKAYYTNDTHEFYATGITKTQDNHYALSCWLVTGMGPYESTNSILKTDQNGNSVFFNRYNILSPSKPGSDIISYFDVTGTTENYAMDGSYNFAGAGTDPTLRLLSTDPAGNTCGQVADPIITNPYSSILSSMPYSSYVLQGSSAISFDSLPVQITDTACNPLDPGHRWALAIQNTTQLTNSLSIYPTLLEESNNDINLDLDVEQYCMLKIDLVTIDGRIIAQSQFSFGQGNNHFVWKLPYLTPGQYVIKATSPDGAISQTIKLTKL